MYGYQSYNNIVGKFKTPPQRLPLDQWTPERQFCTALTHLTEKYAPRDSTDVSELKRQLIGLTDLNRGGFLKLNDIFSTRFPVKINYNIDSRLVINMETQENGQDGSVKLTQSKRLGQILQSHPMATTDSKYPASQRLSETDVSPILQHDYLQLLGNLLYDEQRHTLLKRPNPLLLVTTVRTLPQFGGRGEVFSTNKKVFSTTDVFSIILAGFCICTTLI